MDVVDCRVAVPSLASGRNVFPATLCSMAFTGVGGRSGCVSTGGGRGTFSGGGRGGTGHERGTRGQGSRSRVFDIVLLGTSVFPGTGPASTLVRAVPASRCVFSTLDKQALLGIFSHGRLALLACGG